MRKKAVVLLSGGLDSTTTLGIAHHYQVQQQRIVTIDLRAFGGSALTADIAVPHGQSFDQMSQNIPITYVPARNTIFLSFALAYAEVTGANDIFLGINAIDYSGYPDCRPAYLEAYERMANLATKAAIQDGRVFRFHAPLLYITKAAGKPKCPYPASHCTSYSHFIAALQ